MNASGHLPCRIGSRTVTPAVSSSAILAVRSANEIPMWSAPGADASTCRVSVEEDELDRAYATGVGPAEVLAVHVLDVPPRACLSGIGGEVDMVVVHGVYGLRCCQREGENDIEMHHRYLLELEKTPQDS